MATRRPALLLLLAATLLRLTLAAAFGPGNDEAYYRLYTVHPDLSYLDHPPMVGWIQAIGLGIIGDEVSPLAIRVGFVVLGAVTLLGIIRLTRRVFGERAALFAAAAWCGAGYFGLISGTFALPDGPLLCAWVWCLDALAAAISCPGHTRAWLAAGLLWGLALLSKYHAVFLPLGVLPLFLRDRPLARACLRRSGPYLAVLLAMMVFSPVFYWNARHGWASFTFQGQRAVGRLTPRPDLLAGVLLGQAAYLLPWMWAFLLLSLRKRLSLLGPASADPAQRLLIGQTVVPLAAFLTVGTFRPLLPHWSLVGFVPLFAFLGADWAELAVQSPSRMRRRIAICLLLPLLGAGTLMLQARTGLLPVPAVADPTAELSGWDEVALAIQEGGYLDAPGRFAFTSSWYDSGQLAFALARRGLNVPVLCYSARDARGFAFWSRPEDWIGQDGLLVVVDPCSTEPAAFDRWFEVIEPLGSLTIRRGARPIRRVRLYLCEAQRLAFPFAPLQSPGSDTRLALTDRAAAANLR